MPPGDTAWTESHVRRLFWRAGFGATPQEAAQWAARGREATLSWLLDGGSGALRGPAPLIDGRPLDPVNEWGEDALWWLDRMVRSQRPLVEKMTLFWHDHFATTDQDAPLLLRQNKVMRARALGPFPRLLQSMTTDPAMQLFLSLADSDKSAPNENFARELMELFTLGSGYTERDIREAARALTGFRARWDDGFRGIYYDRKSHDTGVKRIFGKRGRFDWRDVLRLVTSHPRHAPFLVGKLWSFFITEPPSKRTVKQLSAVYRGSKLQIKPVVRAILSHPALYARLEDPDMVKSPLVFLAGALRATGQGVQREQWRWLLDLMGQVPFRPPSVAGWDWGPAWMSSNTMRSRFQCVTYLVQAPGLEVPDGSGDPALTPEQQLERALDATGRPFISQSTRATLLDLAARFYDDLPAPPRGQTRRQERADMLQRSLRHVLLSGPDAQLH